MQGQINSRPLGGVRVGWGGGGGERDGKEGEN
jgi:hypothetical protein